MSVQYLAATQLSDGRPQVWASKNDGNIASTWKANPDSDSGWLPWQPFSGQPLGTKIFMATAFRDGAAVLFGLSPNPGPPGPFVTTAHKVSTAQSAPWSTWTVAFNGNCADVTAALLQDGRLQAFAVTSSTPQGPTRVVTRWKNNSDPTADWSGQGDMSPPGDAGVVKLITFHLPDGRLQLIGAAQNGLLTTFKVTDNPNSAWSGWSGFPGVPGTHSPAQFTWAPLPDKRPQIFLLNRFGDLYSTWSETTDSSQQFVPWQPFVGAPPHLAAITAVPLLNARIVLIVADTSGRVFTTEKASPDPNSAWLPWQQFATP